MPHVQDLGRRGHVRPSHGYAIVAEPIIQSNLSNPFGRKRAAALPSYTTANSSTKQRAVNRRIAELERENYHENISIEIPKLFLIPGNASKDKKNGNNRVGATVASRRIMASKKTLTNYLDDDPSSASIYMGAVAPPSVYPSRSLCSICGYWGSIKCIRCGEKYCSLSCETTHRETRCLKVYS